MPCVCVELLQAAAEVQWQEARKVMEMGGSIVVAKNHEHIALFIEDAIQLLVKLKETNERLHGELGNKIKKEKGGKS